MYHRSYCNLKMLLCPFLYCPLRYGNWLRLAVLAAVTHTLWIFFRQKRCSKTKVFRIKLIIMKKDRTAISFYKPLKQRRRENKNKMQTGEERIDRLIDWWCLYKVRAQPIRIVSCPSSTCQSSMFCSQNPRSTCLRTLVQGARSTCRCSNDVCRKNGVKGRWGLWGLDRKRVQ